MTKSTGQYRLTDHSVALLLHLLPQVAKPVLIVADENWAGCQWPATTDCTVICNRFEIARAALQPGLETGFNDFQCDDFSEHQFATVLYRVSKERPTSHHIINCAARVLQTGGILYLSGEKNHGIKTYAKNAAKLLGGRDTAKKHGDSYLAEIEKTLIPQRLLDCKDYPQLRPIGEQLGINFASKPGIFGWNKIDQGSAFLVEHLAEFLAPLKSKHSLLDLGCGYGYISCLANQLQRFSTTVATDNNAAALAACQHNLQQLQACFEVVASDAGDAINDRFDVILCNPPFHQGFAVEGDLTLRFLQAAARLLGKEGAALFVVNSFIPLEKKAEHLFRHIQTVANNGQFKLVQLKQ